MNLILLPAIGPLVFIGTYMILPISLVCIVIGTPIYTHAGDPIIMSMGEHGPHMSEPLIQGHARNFVDLLLRAIILTAIVTEFSMTAFLLVLVYRTYGATKEDEVSALKGDEDDE